jgi:hypothetical protein
MIRIELRHAPALATGLLLLIAASCTSVPPALRSVPLPVATHPQLEQLVVEWVNEHRREVGLAPLAEDGVQSSVARRASSELARWRNPMGNRENRARELCRHEPFSEIAEHYGSQLLGDDEVETLRSVVLSWLADPQVSADLQGGFEGIGIGVSVGPDDVLHVAQILVRWPYMVSALGEPAQRVGGRDCRHGRARYES